MLTKPFAAAVAAFITLGTPCGMAQLAQHAPGSDEADLSVFELASGKVRVRVAGGPAFGSGLLELWGPANGAPSSWSAIVLDGAGAWSLDLPRALAAELEGARLRATVGGSDGDPIDTNDLTVGSWNGVAQQRGDLVVAEFMKDPASVSDSDGEWVELYNPNGFTRQISGWMLHDGGSNMHVIQAGGPFILVGPGQRYLLGNESDPALNGGLALDYQYSSFSLSNGADEILLTARNGQLVDSVVYDDGLLWPDLAGVAINLDPAAHDALLNDDPTRWCAAQTPIGSTNPDLGTPGAPNDVCP